MRIVLLGLVLLLSGLTMASNVLVIHGTHSFLPYQRSIDDALIKHAQLDDLQFFVEYLDVRRLGGLSEGFWLEYLQNKYVNVDFDAVVAINNGAARFVNKYRKSSFANIPLAIYSATQDIPVTSPDLLLTADFREAVVFNLQLALDHNPNLRHVSLLGSSTQATNIIADELQRQLRGTDIDYYRVEDISDQAVQEWLASLPKNSVIMYSAMFNDAQGRPIVPRNYIQSLAQKTNVPIYTHYSSFLGSGVVGGMMLDTDVIGESIVRAITDQKLGIQRETAEYQSLRAFVDDEVRDRLGLANTELSVTLINPVASFSVRYSQQIFMLLWFSSGAILLTLVWIIRQRRLTQALHIKNAQIHASHEQLKQANDKLEQLAVTDRLTGVFNRHAAEPMLDKAVFRIERNQTPFSLMIVDLDDFKQVNDQYGHPVGDAVIKAVAEIIRKRFRGEDLVARWGGDEFLVLVQCDHDAAVRIARQLSKNIVDAQSSLYGVTVSIGLAAIEQGEGWLDAYHRADERLYHAKRSGKNAVCE